MEERVRVCRSCNGIVGWFALFCEACGMKQEPRGTPAGQQTAGGAPPSAPPPPAEVPRAAPETIDAEIRTHLTAPPTDARAVARDLFQTQLHLIHRHRERVEELIADVEAMKKDVSAAGRGKSRVETRRILDGLSERMFDAEQRWGELQVSYNRDSEAIEEESRESMETADIDAYLSPDENEKVESEYAILTSRFEAVDELLRDAGRAIALSRQGAASSYLGGGVPRGTPRVVLLLLTAGLVAWSMYSSLFQYKDDPIRVAATVGPVLLSLGLWVVFGFSRRTAS